MKKYLIASEKFRQAKKEMEDAKRNVIRDITEKLDAPETETANSKIQTVSLKMQDILREPGMILSAKTYLPKEQKKAVEAELAKAADYEDLIKRLNELVQKSFH